MMNYMSNMSTGRMLFQSALGYGIATFVSYRYNELTKAQQDLRAIEDKKSYLHQIHENTAETYNDLMARREFSNKLQRYRKVLLSYAEGDVLECGIGTGKTLQNYDHTIVNSFVGIDWSSNMLIKAFEKIEDLKREENKFPFEKNENYKLKGKDYFKLMQADAHSLPFNDN